MKKGIHPESRTVNVVCSCGAKFEVQSTLKDELVRVEICSKCHPFYT
jgi:large subunit ribosomal protein L31